MSERGNKISGSGIAALALCNGKFQLESQVPDTDDAGPYALMGTRIHSFLAGEEIALNQEEANIAALCQENYSTAIETIGQEVTDSIIEARYWYEESWSGQIDRIDFFGSEKAMVTDYKTGRNSVGYASENLQLRAYAVLVKKHFPQLKEIYVAIIAPMTGESLTIAHYDESDLAMADKEISDIIAKALAPDAKRSPSPDACKYCRAKAICPEAQGEVRAMVKVDTAIVPQLTNDQLSDYLEKVEILEPLFEAFRSEAKKRLQDGQEIAGRKLQAGRTTRSVSAEDAWKVIQKSGNFLYSQFLEACKVSIPQLEKVVARAFDLNAKEAKAILEEKLADVMETKTSEPIMVRAK
jgi:CRISPR/Cas system-associated exonuclease Cas4 (RecB family)